MSGSQTTPKEPTMDEKPKLNKESPKELTPESTTPPNQQPLPSIEEQDKILYRQFLALKGYPKKPDPSKKN